MVVVVVAFGMLLSLLPPLLPPLLLSLMDEAAASAAAEQLTPRRTELCNDDMEDGSDETPPAAADAARACINACCVGPARRALAAAGATAIDQRLGQPKRRRKNAEGIEKGSSAGSRGLVSVLACVECAAAAREEIWCRSAKQLTATGSYTEERDDESSARI